MNYTFYPGGMYCEALPGGDWAVLYPDARIEASRPVAWPGLNILYLRITNTAGQLQIAGQGADGLAWLWDGTRWTQRGPAYGVSPCAFWPDGQLEISTPEKGYGSQGIRWIDSRVHTGDETYVEPALGLTEYTRCGDVVVGQGSVTGVEIVHGSMRKQLALGLAYFIRANRRGDDLAIAWWEKTGSGLIAHLVWMTVAEIAALPDVIARKPEPKPEPTPMPQTPDPEAGLVIVRRVQNELGSPHTVEGAFAIAMRVAWYYRAIGGGLVKAPRGGENVVERNGQFFRAGRISFNGQTVKILTDVPTTNGPTWSVDDYEPELYVPAIEPDSMPDSGPDEPTSGTIPDINTAVDARVRAALAPLEQRINELFGFGDTITTLEARLAALESQPSVGFPSRIALKSDHGKYLCAEGDLSVNANRESAGAWETWTVEPK